MKWYKLWYKLSHENNEQKKLILRNNHKMQCLIDSAETIDNQGLT